jgi:Cu-Zn family superoxide dismutase
MKKNLWVVVILCAGNVWAGEMSSGYTPPKLSAELEGIKSLEGKWTGTSTDKGEEKPATAEYHVTSGGTAVEEKLFCGSGQEMVSMYHDVNGKLSMTHYCALGNQPQLELKNSSAGKWDLKESDASKTVLSGQMRMSSLVIELSDEGTLVQTWTAEAADGRPLEPTIIKLKRVGSETIIKRVAPQAAAIETVVKGTKEGSVVSGKAVLKDTPEGLQISAAFENVPPGKHGFHIHENGSCAEEGNAAGGHYNPDGAPHGYISKDGVGYAHVGDLGNVEIGADGKGRLDAVIPALTLKDGKYNVIGRAFILHEKEDDFGQPTGNAGGRIACGEIK